MPPAGIQFEQYRLIVTLGEMWLWNLSRRLLDNPISKRHTKKEVKN